MLALAAAVGVFAGATLASRAATDSFASAMDASMMRMHEALSRPGTGDPDHDFAAMMIPHHQGAIEMAEAELRFGHDPVLRRLAQGIIVEQQQEITVMRQALAAMSTSSTSAHNAKEP
jgi:uncharacterized protein (DUF305 family)